MAVLTYLNSTKTRKISEILQMVNFAILESIALVILSLIMKTNVSHLYHFDA